jgi:hypothetical protein
MNRREALKSLGLSLGYVVTAPAAISVLQSCSGKEETWTSLFFREDEKQMVSYLVDIILPVSDILGGLDVNLPQFIDMMCNDTLKESDKELFHQGSQFFGNQYHERFKKDINNSKKDEIREVFSSYFDLDQAEQDKVKFMQSKNVDDLAGEEKKNFTIYKFLIMVRSLSLLGYFTSEQIGKEVLSFDPIPGGYQACIPVSEIGNAWTI